MFIILFRNPLDISIFHYFCKVKKITKMKKIIVISSVIIAVSLLLCACAEQSKCPAYGHYSQLEQPVQTDNETNL